MTEAEKLAIRLRRAMRQGGITPDTGTTESGTMAQHTQAQEELDLGDDESDVAGESKAERWTRLVNYRMAVAIKRLRMIRRLTGPNYQYEPERAAKVIAYLREEVAMIEAALIRDDTPDELPQI